MACKKRIVVATAEVWSSNTVSFSSGPSAWTATKRSSARALGTAAGQSLRRARAQTVIRADKK
eukprot:7321311-Alexandrium_andersonii.AAC.1